MSEERELRVLILEDQATDAESMERELSSGGADTIATATLVGRRDRALIGHHPHCAMFCLLGGESCSAATSGFVSRR